MYICVKLPPRDLNLGPYPHTHKYLYLSNDHHTNDARW